MTRVNLNDAMDAIAKSLREFGYPDVSREMIREIWNAYLEGKRGKDLPHGVVGMFAESQIKEHDEMLRKLK